MKRKILLWFERGLGLMTFKLYLDPGHGGKDRGASAYGLTEKQVTLLIADRIREIIEREYTDVNVRMSRENDTEVSVEERVRAANLWGADFFLSLHVDAGDGTGFEDCIFTKAGNGVETYRSAIHRAVLRATGWADRGKGKADFSELMKSGMPAVMTKNGFIETRADNTKLRSEMFIGKIARGHVNGLAAAFGLKKKKGADQAGRFLVRVRARDLYYYGRPDWSARNGLVHKGQVFAVIRTLTVNQSKMYALNNGNYLTANENYVEKIL